MLYASVRSWRRKVPKSPSCAGWLSVESTSRQSRYFLKTVSPDFCECLRDDLELKALFCIHLVEARVLIFELLHAGQPRLFGLQSLAHTPGGIRTELGGRPRD